MAVRTGRKAAFGLLSSRTGRKVCLAATLLALGAYGLQQADAIGDTRTISLHHVHTNEDITITYKRNGRYDDEALAKLNWFLRDWRKNEQVKMDPQLIDLLWEVHREVGAKVPIYVVCGYRTPETNALLRSRSNGVAQFSQHMNGNATDFFIPGVPIDDIRAAALRLQGGGVGYYPAAGSRFVHMDVGSIRMWPRMTREELVRVFPNQRTVHIPADGHPLAGYALALADLERGVRPSVQPKATTVAKLNGAQDDEDHSAVAASQAQAPVMRLANAVAPAVVKMAAVPATATPPLPPSRPTHVAYAVEVGKVPSPPGSKTVTVPGPATVEALFNPRPGEIDRVSPDVALAYAARNEPSKPVPLQNIQRSSMMQPAAQAPAPQQAPVAAPARPAVQTASLMPAPAKAGAAPVLPARLSAHEVTGTLPLVTRNLNNPWIRAVVMAPSMYHFMSSTQFNAPDARQIVAQVQKPKSVMMMTFSSDPYNGMTSEGFTGRAVQFMATVYFGMQTAALR